MSSQDLKNFSLPLFLNKKGVYYGWIILVVGTIGVVMSIPGQTMGISVYTDYLIKSLGISRLQLSLAYMFGTLTSSFLLPYAGQILDRFGARVLYSIASLFLGLFLILLSFSPDISQYLSQTTSFPSPWLSVGVVFICFLGIRHFGQGHMTMSSRTMLGLWFEKNRGLVLGFSGSAVAFSFGLAPLVLNDLIESYDWQTSMQLIALASFITSLFALMFFRRSPEHSGLQIDGGLLEEESTDKNSNSEGVIEGPSITCAQAKKTLVFWTFNLGLAAHATLLTAMVFHMSKIAQINSMTSIKAFSIFLPVAVISTGADLIGGYVSDRVPLRYILAVMQVGLLTGLIGLEFFYNDLGFYVMALGVGISGGLYSLLTSVAWPKLFGRKHLGSIAGFSMSWVVSGSAIGPYLYSLGESFTGNYNLAIYISMLVPLSLIIASFVIRNPLKYSQ